MTVPGASSSTCSPPSRVVSAAGVALLAQHPLLGVRAARHARRRRRALPLLGADFVGVAQLLIYIGGILVLHAVRRAAHQPHRRDATSPTASAGLLVGAPPAVALIALLRRASRCARRGRRPKRCRRRLTARLGDAFLRELLMPFEVVVAGAADGARRRHGDRAPRGQGAGSRMNADRRRRHRPAALPRRVGDLCSALGLLTVATRRNAVAILMGVELILNAAALNFVAFAHFVAGAVGGAGVRAVHHRARRRRGGHRAGHRAGHLPPLPLHRRATTCRR